MRRELVFHTWGDAAQAVDRALFAAPYDLELIQVQSQLSVGGGAIATGTLTSDATNVLDAETVTIGTTVYTFKNALTAAYQVKIGADAATSLSNLKKAINASGVAGTDYGIGTLIHPTVTAGALTATTLVVSANLAGTAGNAIATTETSIHLSFGGGTLAGGLDCNVQVTNAKPGQTPAQGAALLSAAADMTVTAIYFTPRTAGLASSRIVKKGNSVCLDWTGTVTGVVGYAITLVFLRIGRTLRA